MRILGTVILMVVSNFAQAGQISYRLNQDGLNLDQLQKSIQTQMLSGQGEVRLTAYRTTGTLDGHVIGNPRRSLELTINNEAQGVQTINCNARLFGHNRLKIASCQTHSANQSPPNSLNDSIYAQVIDLNESITEATDIESESEEESQ